ncbi:hypothetical protein PG994_008544 [Apiospora phragmitis]|uniref:Uncharacterized protein n=1 Tax=Apiospora phragmitis TaxID=2905665 RepID=A0ABR1UGS8_9PEZI
MLHLATRQPPFSRVNESRRGWYAVPYWLSLTLWDGKRDSLWERFLKGDVAEEEDKKTQPIGLTAHVTVRLLYEHRYRVPAVERGDSRLRCGLFKKFRPEGQGQAAGSTRWVKRGTLPEQFLQEAEMGDHEKEQFRTLLEQAKRLRYWSPEQKLKDNGNDGNWIDINNALGWGPIIKGCSYEQTFISLLEGTLKDHTHGAESAEGAEETDGADSIHESLHNLDRRVRRLEHVQLRSGPPAHRRQREQSRHPLQPPLVCLIVSLRFTFPFSKSKPTKQKRKADRLKRLW